MQIHHSYHSRSSGRLLSQALKNTEGPSINWGYPRGGDINKDGAVKVASNKRIALLQMRDWGVPTPRIFTIQFMLWGGMGRGIETLPSPVIGRPNHHMGGSGFYFCRTMKGVRRAVRKGATHFLEYIPDAREFRVHVVNGKSIKLAEKLGGGTRKNFKHGAYFAYPQDFDHKDYLRQIAIEAVMSLGLDFGAVDILYKEDSYFVLEVNTAPSLISRSDVLERYVRAFKDNYGVI